MTDSDLNPPRSIVGRFNYKTESAVVKERLKWVIEVRSRGYKISEIAEALSISNPTVSRIYSAHRSKIKRPKNPRFVERIIFRVGLRFGRISKAVGDMPTDAQIALIDAAAKTGKTLSDVLAESYAESSFSSRGQKIQFRSVRSKALL